MPAGVEVKIVGPLLTVTGKNGELSSTIHYDVEVKHDNNELTFSPRDGIVRADTQPGPARPLFNQTFSVDTARFTKMSQLMCVC
ncbi:50S ribosomal protein L6, partial [Pasteurella multocida]|uniref:50S ribosomal protein L6 n=1 Tax=Pasteurella multocida TaxID=747 RepID=UPI003D15FF65